MTYLEEFDDMQYYTSPEDASQSQKVERLTFKALDEIIQRLDDLQHKTKPQAVMDEAYKNLPARRPPYEPGLTTGG